MSRRTKLLVHVVDFMLGFYLSILLDDLLTRLYYRFTGFVGSCVDNLFGFMNMLGCLFMELFSFFGVVALIEVFRSVSVLGMMVVVQILISCLLKCLGHVALELSSTMKCLFRIIICLIRNIEIHFERHVHGLAQLREIGSTSRALLI